MKMLVTCVLTLIVLALPASRCIAADSGPGSPAPDNLAAARARIAEKNWPSAIEELKRVNEPGSADWNNLMAYSLRNSGAAEYAAAEKFYDEALRIDSKHRGALEYSGELYLAMGNLAMAEQRLATLDKACFFPCEEFTDLKAAVARYKTAGRK